MQPANRNGSKNKIAVILAGGESRRFGSNKAFAKIGDETFLEKIAATAGSLGFEIFLSVSDPEIYKHFSFKMLPDILPKEGPLQALYSALSQLHVPRVLLLPCDMPLTTSKIIEEMWHKSSRSDICLLQTSPLPGVYSRKTLPFIKKLLDLGKRDLQSLLEGPFCIKKIYSDFDSHININTRADFFKMLTKTQKTR